MDGVTYAPGAPPSAMFGIPDQMSQFVCHSFTPLKSVADLPGHNTPILSVDNHFFAMHATLVYLVGAKILHQQLCRQGRIDAITRLRNEILRLALDTIDFAGHDGGARLVLQNL